MFEGLNLYGGNLDSEFVLDSLIQAITHDNYLNLNKLREEFEAALLDEDFNWVDIAYSSGLIWMEGCSKADVVDEVLSYMLPYIFPEQVLSEEDYKHMESGLMSLVESLEDGDATYLGMDYISDHLSALIGKKIYYFQIFTLFDRMNYLEKYSKRKNGDDKNGYHRGNVSFLLKKWQKP